MGPGKYAKEWDDLVDDTALCTACVFLTNPAAGLGKHAEDPDRPGKCFCSFIYGKLPPEAYINILHAPRSQNEQAEHEEKRRFAEADAQAMGQILVDENDCRDPYAFYEAQRL